MERPYNAAANTETVEETGTQILCSQFPEPRLGARRGTAGGAGGGLSLHWAGQIHPCWLLGGSGCSEGPRRLPAVLAPGRSPCPRLLPSQRVTSHPTLRNTRPAPALRPGLPAPPVPHLLMLCAHLLICCLFLSPLKNIGSSSVCPVVSPPTQQNLVHSQCSINAYWRKGGRKAGRREGFLAQSGTCCVTLAAPQFPQLQKWGHAAHDLTVPPATRPWVSRLWLQLPGAGSGPGCQARPAPRGPALLTPDSFLDGPAIWPTFDPGLAPRPASTNQPARASRGTRARLCGH